MKKNARKLLFGLIGLVPLVFAHGVLADQTPTTATKTTTHTMTPASEVDPRILDVCQTAIQNTYGSTSDIVGLYYNEKESTVDLSTFDGHTFTVPVGELFTVNPNGE